MTQSVLRISLIKLLAASSSFLIHPSCAAPSTAVDSVQAIWPYGPFVTEGRDIKNTLGENVVYAGTNWPGHGDVMIPEGLQYQSIKTIASKIRSIGMNSIRLTYAIEMIDQIYANDGQDISIKKAFIDALGEVNGTTVFGQVVANNPSFSDATTRLEVFDAVAKECAEQEIFVHLDNHISKGTWCCSGDDGNSWFGDTYFDVANWTRGLAYMANHASSWTAFVSQSLRNELRDPTSNTTLSETSYNWQDWYKYIKLGTAAIHGANSDVIIVLSGLNYDTTMKPVVQGTALTPGTEVFNLDDFAGYTDKLVIELHNYATTATDCPGLQTSLYNAGYQALHPEDATTKHVFPVLLTEFGFLQNSTNGETVYPTCLADLLTTEKSGWMIWVLVGSYYIRSGEQDFEETWGMLTHDWSAWRSPEYVEGGLMPLSKNTASP